MPDTTATKTVRTQRDQSPNGTADTKASKVIKLMRRKNGATIDDLQKATGWQAHSVRGFVSGTVKKRMGLNVTSQKPDGKVRRYQIAGDAT